MNERRFDVGLRRRNRERKRERGAQCGAAVVTMANAAWCDVSLAAEPS